MSNNIIRGQHIGTGMSVAIVVSRFNSTITQNLLQGALETLQSHGVTSESILTVWVPGAFEIPATAALLAAQGSYDAVICLGAVIRGATDHYDYVCGQTTSGIAAVAKEHGLPCIFGLLTCDTIDQALERSGIKGGNKGHDAAVAAIEMVNVYRQIEALTPSRQSYSS